MHNAVGFSVNQCWRRSKLHEITRSGSHEKITWPDQMKKEQEGYPAEAG